MTPRPPARSLRSPRLIALALACVAVQLLGVVHLGLVRHTYCATHGELGHVDAAHAEADAAHAAAARALAAPRPGDAPTVAIAHAAALEDEHCPLTAVPQAPAAALAALRPTAIAHAPPPALVTTPRAAAVALYRLAPKASPPARA